MHELLREIEYICTHLENETLDSVMNEMSAANTESSYEEFLDDCHGEIEICGYKYGAAYAFESVDPIAYRCAYHDYVSNDESLVEYGDHYYHVDELTDWIDQYEHLKKENAV